MIDNFHIFMSSNVGFELRMIKGLTYFFFYNRDFMCGFFFRLLRIKCELCKSGSAGLVAGAGHAQLREAHQNKPYACRRDLKSDCASVGRTRRLSAHSQGKFAC